MSSSRSRRSRDLTWFPRLLGVATAGYSVAIIASPELFTKPTALQAEGAPLPTATAIGVRALGGRDLASGLAMALAPAGKALRTAVAVRVGSDVVDLVLLGTLAAGQHGTGQGGRRRGGVGHAVRPGLPRRDGD